MLNPFGLEYTGETLRAWLQRDPSLRYAVGLAAVVYALGRSGPPAGLVRRAAFAFTVGFAPLALWIWDIPLLDRPICKWGHDSRITLPLLGRLRSLWFYAWGAAVFTLVSTYPWVRRVLDRRHSAAQESAPEEWLPAVE